VQGTRNKTWSCCSRPSPATHHTLRCAVDQQGSEQKGSGNIHTVRHLHSLSSVGRAANFKHACKHSRVGCACASWGTSILSKSSLLTSTSEKSDLRRRAGALVLPCTALVCAQSCSWELAQHGRIIYAPALLTSTPSLLPPSCSFTHPASLCTSCSEAKSAQKPSTCDAIIQRGRLFGSLASAHKVPASELGHTHLLWALCCLPDLVHSARNTLFIPAV